MQMTDAEKLILLMLCDIHEKLSIDGDIDAVFVKSAIYTGNTWGLKWKFTGVFDDTEGAPPIVGEVSDILDMWSFIESCYAQLSPEDKKRVEKEVPYHGKNPKFPGFDGNNETEHMGVAEFLIDDLERFSMFKGRDLNSHMPYSLAGYQRMLEVFLPLRSVLMHAPFTADQIISIMNAKVKPEGVEEHLSNPA
jgi:uncharacterized protein YfbU (UPF0304 family)